MERPAIGDYPPGAQMPPRVLDDFGFVWMLAGNARVTLDDDELPLGPGQLLLVPPGVRHGFLWDTTNVRRHGYVHFGPQCFEGSLPARLELRPMTADDPLAGLCAYLLWLAGAEPDDWQRRSSDTLAFMLRLFVGGPLPGPDTPAGWRRRSRAPSSVYSRNGHTCRCAAWASASWPGGPTCHPATSTGCSEPASASAPPRSSGRAARGPSRCSCAPT